MLEIESRRTENISIPLSALEHKNATNFIKMTIA